MPAQAAKSLEDTGREAGRLRRSLIATAWVASLFSALVCGVMVYQHFTAAANDPWKSPQLLSRKERLVTEPRNELLKEEIRALDLQFRQKFRHRLALDNFGGWLLLGGTVLLAVAARKVADFGRIVPLPQPVGDRAGRITRLQARTRWAVAAVACTVVGGLVVVYLALGTVLPSSDSGWRKLAGKDEPNENTAFALPDLATLQANSPRFRGWDGSGATTRSNFSLSWNDKTGSGIAWKSAIPAPGHNSPVVWGHEVFITGGTANLREAFAYEVTTGTLLWRRAIGNVPGSSPGGPDVSDLTGNAASTAATDGRHLYVIFANGDLAALNFDGQIAWNKTLGPLKNMYGHAASLATWRGTVLVQLDQGDTPGVDSKLIAIDGGNGRILWQQPRPVTASWATPIVIEAAGQAQIITLGLPWVIGSSFANGSELWRADLLENEIVPSPIFAAGLVIAISPSSKMVALRPDGAGDVTKTHLAWSSEENVPDIVSPVSNGELVFTVTSSGMLTCFEVKTGAKIWQHDLSLGVQASPAIAGGGLFILAEEGVAVVVAVERQFREISRSELPDRFSASPAFADGRVFLRGQTNLYCIGSSATQPERPR